MSNPLCGFCKLLRQVCAVFLVAVLLAGVASGLYVAFDNSTEVFFPSGD